MTQDIDIQQAIKIENGVATTVELNGKTLKGGIFTESNGEFTEGTTDSYVFMVTEGGELTINGEGTVEAQEAKYSIAVWAKGGKVVINNGTFKNGEGSDLIYASEGGQVEIYGGEFFPGFIPAGTEGTAQPYCALNLKNDGKDGSKIVVYGGKFHNFNPADNKSETAAWRDANPNQFVAEGCQSTEISEGIWEVTAV